MLQRTVYWRIAAIDTFDGAVEEAVAPMNVTIRLEDELDISRGDVICRPHNRPTVAQDIDAMLCWMSRRPMRARTIYAIKHTTRTTRALVKDLRYRVDVNSCRGQKLSGVVHVIDASRFNRDLAESSSHQLRAIFVCICAAEQAVFSPDQR